MWTQELFITSRISLLNFGPKQSEVFYVTIRRHSLHLNYCDKTLKGAITPPQEAITARQRSGKHAPAARDTHETTGGNRKASVPVAAESCSSGRCIAMTSSCASSIPPFRLQVAYYLLHVTVPTIWYYRPSGVPTRTSLRNNVVDEHEYEEGRRM
jgi:hypothetical protein